MSAHYYRAYGLVIQACRPLPGLRETDPAEPDVLIRSGQIDVPEVLCRRDQWRCVWGEENDVFVHWRQTVSIRVRDGKEIVVDAHYNVDDRIPGVVLAGTGMGILLHQRGLLTLHASAVAVNGGALAFLGGKGMGKSTTASIFYEAGYSFMTDDIAALSIPEESGGEIMLAAGGHSTKLSVDSRAAFDVREDELIDVYEGVSKRYRRLDGTCEHDAHPVRRIYLLDYVAEDGPEPRIEPVKPREIVVQLVAHSFALRFLGERADSRRCLEQSSEVARRIPIRRLRRVPDMQKLSSIVDCVEEDLETVREAAGVET